MNHRLQLCLKIVVSTLLLGWIFSRIDFQTVVSQIGTLNPLYLLAVFVLSLLGFLISTEKWRLLLASLEQRPSYWALLRLFWMGAFFNNFLPGRTGGDVIRAYGIAPATQNNTQAITSVIVDRGLNLIALVALAWVSLIATSHTLPEFPHTVLIAGSSLVMAASTLGFVYLRNAAPIQTTRFKWLQEAVMALQNIAKMSKTFAKASLLSLLYQSTVVLSNYGVAKSLGIDLNPSVFFFAIPVTALITLIPISLNGFGLREGAYALIFVPLGISSASAISISLVATGCMMAISLVGGLLYAFGSVRLSPNTKTLTHKPSNV